MLEESVMWSILMISKIKSFLCLHHIMAGVFSQWQIEEETEKIFYFECTYPIFSQ